MKLSMREADSLFFFVRRRLASLTWLPFAGWLFAGACAPPSPPTPPPPPPPAPPIGGLIGHYLPDEFSPAVSNVANRVDGSTGLVFAAVRSQGTAAESPRRTAGRSPERSAVALDRSALAGPCPGPLSNGFSVALWIRIHGQGGMFGNASASNGTVIAVGSGYTDGWRITADSVRRTLSFSIGRPEPARAATITSEAAPFGAWMHVAATWDRRRMRLFIDGRIAAERELVADYQRPANDTLRIGYADYGVGSLRMDVDEAMMFSRPLSASEALRLSAPEHAATAAFVEAYDEAIEAWAARNVGGARTAVERAVSAAGNSGPFRAAARRLVAAAARSAGDTAAEAAAWLAIAEEESMPDAARTEARHALLGLLRRGALSEAPEKVIERTAAWPEATVDDRLESLLLLGARAIAAGQWDMAAVRYNAVAQDPAAPARHRSLAMLALARIAREQGNLAGARASLAAVRDLPDAPLSHRDEAVRLLAGSPAAPDRLSPPPTCPPPALSLYVAPDGDDGNPGTRERPFASLERARDALRERRRQAPLPRGGAAIWMAPGVYPVRATFTLDARDSGTADAPIIWRALDPSRPPVISGGVRLVPRPVAPARRALLPPAARERAVEFDLAAAGLTNLPPLVLGGFGSGRGFRTHPTIELFHDGVAMPRSRWPNQGFVTTPSVHGPTAVEQHGRPTRGCREGVIGYDGDRPAQWRGEPALLLQGYWFHSWADSYEAVAAIDTSARRIELAPPWHRYGYQPGGYWCAVNAVSEIDAPGEWAIDPSARVIVTLPPDGAANGPWIASAWPDFMLQAEGLTHTAFLHIVWEYGAADAVQIRRSTNCVFAGCVIRHFAGNGLSIDGGQSNGVRSCDVYSMGRGALVVAGGDRASLTPGAHTVENCHLHHLSRIHPTYTPAILLTGVGHRIAHNLAHDIRSSAFRIAGNDHRVELNEVFDVVLESDDQGGIDMWGNPTYRGNVFLHNYWHHIGNRPGGDVTARVGRAAIRLDDAISGVVIRGNIFHRCGAGVGWCGAVQVHGGKDNDIDGNIVSHGPAAVSLSPWSDGRWREFVAGALQRPDVNAALFTQRYPALATLADDANRNDVLRNWVWRCGALTYGRAAAVRSTGNLIIAGPSPFVDGEHGDFRLRPGERWPACLGPEPIPFEAIGLRRDPYRAEVPDDMIAEARRRVP